MKNLARKWRDGLDQGYLVIGVGRVVMVGLSFVGWLLSLFLSYVVVRLLFGQNTLIGFVALLLALFVSLLALCFGGGYALRSARRLKEHRFEANASRSGAVARLISAFADLTFIFGGAIALSLLGIGLSFSPAPFQLGFRDNVNGGHVAIGELGVIPREFLTIGSLGATIGFALLGQILIYFLVGHALSALIEGVGESATALKKLTAERESAPDSA